MKHFKLTLGILALMAGNLHAAAIHRAARQGSSMLLQSQLGKGVSPDARDEHGNTPLHLTRNKRTATILIANGAEVNAKNKYGSTPLHLLPLKGALGETNTSNIGMLLLKNGADANAPDSDGNTPLHEAARFGRLTFIRNLLAHNANPDAKNNDGLTPLHASVGLMAITSSEKANLAALGMVGLGLEGIIGGISFLSTKLAEWTVSSHEFGGTSRYRQQELLKDWNLGRLRLKRSGIKFSEEYTKWLKGPRPLVQTEEELAREANPEIFRFAEGASKAFKISLAVASALALIIITAKVTKRYRTMKALIDGGGDVNATDNLGNNPLHFMAATRKLKIGQHTVGFFSALKLVQAGADKKAKNDAGYTPYQIARKNNRIVLARVLKPKRNQAR